MNTKEQEKATPRPWQLDFEKHYSGAEGFTNGKPMQSFAIKSGRKVVCAVLSAWRKADPQAQADGELIVKAANEHEALCAVADAAAEVRRLEVQIEQDQTSLEAFRDGHSDVNEATRRSSINMYSAEIRKGKGALIKAKELLECAIANLAAIRSKGK